MALRVQRRQWSRLSTPRVPVASPRASRAALAVASVFAATALTFACQNSVTECDATSHANKLTKVSTKPDISMLNEQVLDDVDAPMRERMQTYVKLLQRRLVDDIEAEENAGRKSQSSKKFTVESWTRKEGGEGITCVIEDGEVFEKGGINVSVVYGNLPPRAIHQMSADHDDLMQRVGYKIEGPDAEVDGLPFFATGISVVIHPKNPMSPTSHFNYRYFELMHPEKLKDGSPNPKYHDKEPAAWWFGGGADLTPMYLFPEDATHFHSMLKAAADEQDASFYDAWKKWCDKYFWNTHRGENRGVGGVFFDDLTMPTWSRGRPAFIPLYDGSNLAPPMSISSKQHNKESLFRTVRALGDAFIPSYLPLVHKHRFDKYNSNNVEWQNIRRGRYVEFNLVYDRGTKFGLMTPGARIESILMSLPLSARWQYMEGASGTSRDHSSVAQKHLQEEREKLSNEEMDAREKVQEVLEHPKKWV